MIPPENAEQLLADFDRLRATDNEPASLAMRLIANTFAHYKWVGIYWLQGNTLVLGPYVGAPTEHDRIPVGKGVCGTAVAEHKNQIVGDVRTLSNYLSCSVNTRSEIVVLIHNDGQIVGQIDADGHGVGAFDASDEALLVAVAERLSNQYPEKQSSGS
jgi:GAF domain-containing protein